MTVIKKIGKKAVCLLLAAGLFVACASPAGTADTAKTKEQANGKSASDDTYTYHDSVSQLATNWNPHTYMTSNDSYPMTYINSDLYTFVFNDKLHPVDGKEPYESYAIVPDMAAEDPVDVTAEVRASHPQFSIPQSADRGYAFRIRLREDLCWDDGTPITSATYVESLKRLLDPKLLNYRAADTYEGTYSIANSEKYANAGVGVFTSFTDLGTTYDEYIASGGKDEDVYVDISGLWNITTEDNKTYAAITDDTMIRDEAVEEGQPEDYVSAKYIWDTYLATGQIAPAEDYIGLVEYKYDADYSFDNVGLYAEDPYTLVYVFNNALDGYYLAAALSSSWLVKPELYDACLKETKTASGSVWSSTYGTSKDTSASYGPYKIDSYQLDKAIHFSRNENWFGYRDGNHVYIDPVDGKQYDMYQTTNIDCQVIADTTTNKQMFFAGKLATYALQAEDLDQYRNSEYSNQVPAGSTYFIILNDFKDVIEKREQAADFDTKTKDVQTIMLPAFREAFAVSFDKSGFVNTVMPNCSEGFGLIGGSYIYDPDTCEFYRETDEAKQTLCDFYAVDADEYSSLETAEESITGFDPVKGAELFQQAYEEALEKGYLTDEDHDGRSDQTVTITYSLSADSDFMTKMIDYLNESLRNATAGTGLEEKVAVVKSAPLGNDWATQLRSGLTDIVIAGWTGGLMDPFNLTKIYTEPDKAYNGNWFDATKHDMTVKLDGKKVTMSLADWSQALNGLTITVDGQEYNFGYGEATVKERLQILASFENAILSTYDYVPLADSGSLYLLSQQVYYVNDEYNPVMSYGGVPYLRYNYSDREWKAYVKSQNGVLQY